MDKKQIRAQMKAKTGALSEEDRRRRSELLGNALTAREQWRKSDIILLYSALADEIDCSFLIRKAIEQGKTVVLPVVEGDSLRLRKYVEGNTIKGAFGIEEPSQDSPEVDPADISLAIIPGRAFTSEGIRLGRGKGYYDRLLPLLHCPLWGVAYDFQIYSSLPSDPWDIPVVKVFTA